MDLKLLVCGIIVFVIGMFFLAIGYSMVHDPLTQLGHEFSKVFGGGSGTQYARGVACEFIGIILAILGVMAIVLSPYFGEEDEKNKEITKKQLEKKLGIEELKTPKEKEDLNKINRITEIVENYNKKGYKVTKYEFEEPILKMILSKDNKTYLATINVETKKAKYELIEEKKQKE